jgi:molybdate transport system regulatory protein
MGGALESRRRIRAKYTVEHHDRQGDACSTVGPGGGVRSCAPLPVFPTQLAMPKPVTARAAPPIAAPIKSKSKPLVKFRVRISAGETIAIGPGKIDLLEAIAEAGSITSAAKNIGMSYRRAWLLVTELNASLKSPALDSAKGGQHGGGSALTPVGRQLIDTYRRVQATAADACAADIKVLTGLLAR